MDKTRNDRIHDLCSLIAVEKDHDRFLVLVEELSRILSVKPSSDTDEPGHQKTE